jgi:L-ascorbate metabolism protein UlaG (beta-lactamase superfamily)
MAELLVTWYGHGSTRLITPGGVKIIVDPFLTDNPACPPELRYDHDFDLLLITHGHGDHIGDTFRILHESKASVMGIYEMAHYLVSKGVPQDRVIGFNMGGTTHFADISVTMTMALHSGVLYEDDTIVNVGPPVGYVLHLEDERSIYFAGDTDIFSEMEFIGEFYNPFLAVLPIDGFYNMNPKAAARAAQLLRCTDILPIHHSTFPVLKGKPQMLKDELHKLRLDNVTVHSISPGDTLHF